MFENKQEPLLTPREFLKRQIRFTLVALGLVAFSLALGMAGYHFLENLSWLDSLVNASMLLGGMGPVNPLQTTAGKLFASFYALYSGLIFLVVAGVLFAPAFHRILHSFHLDVDEGDAPEDEKKQAD
jgi:flagellar biosynthesis protein FliR